MVSNQRGQALTFRSLAIFRIFGLNVYVKLQATEQLGGHFLSFKFDLFFLFFCDMLLLLVGSGDGSGFLLYWGKFLDFLDGGLLGLQSLISFS